MTPPPVRFGGTVVAAAFTFLAWGCSPSGTPEPPAGTGGSPAATGGKPAGTGGTTAPNTGGSAPGTGGVAPATGGTAPGTGGVAPGTGGSEPPGTGGAGPVDAAPPVDALPPGADANSPPDPAQGPVAAGNIIFSRDFENGSMAGLTRSPNNLPEDRVQMVDDPIKQRGKVVKIHFQQGDNFRTSGGTEPRSWFSAASGYTVRPGTKVSVAWGFMWENANMGAHFAQIIRDGGPLWMFGVSTGGGLAARVHRGSGGTGNITQIEPNKWYDFRVDTDYRGGGTITFWVNGKMVGQGTGAGGAPARFDCGIYWMHNAKPTRTVYLSNVSIGEMP